jgi:hypothetical protein
MRPPGGAGGVWHAAAPGGTHGVAHAPQVMALLDDAAAGASLLELSSALARMLQRDLSVVYVENAGSLLAAALPFTQVLPLGGAAWVPLQAADVEQGFRAHAARLRELTARIALRDALHCSLRVMRGSLSEAALDLQDESDLLLLAKRPPVPMPQASASRSARRRPVVTVLRDDSDASRRALAIATQLARALTGVLDTASGDAAPALFGAAGHPGSGPWPDVLVLPRAPLDARVLERLRCPVLLVG